MRNFRTARPATGELLSAGAAELARLVRRYGARRMARRLGGVCTEGAIRHAAAGRSTPRAKVRDKLAEVYGIDPASFDVGAKLVRPGPRMRQDAPLVVDRGPGPTDYGDAKANAVATLRILRRALEGAESEDVPRIANAVTGCSRLLARLDGSLEVSPQQIVRSAPWQRMDRILREVLSKFEGAIPALDQALANFERGGGP